MVYDGEICFRGGEGGGGGGVGEKSVTNQKDPQNNFSFLHHKIFYYCTTNIYIC